MEGYEVEGYTPEQLIAFFLKGAYRADRPYIEIKTQVQSLLVYCKDEKIRTLVFEPEYVDQFYSEDYSGYYTRPFRTYRKMCSRLHFFREAITPEAFVAAITDDAFDVRTLGYSGFVVIKPLPRTFIGRTCLRAPTRSDGVTGHYPTLRGIRANLFGLQMSVRSLPFQEQDREVAACATSALWTALYATAYAYQHRVLSPLQITQLAAKALPFFTRSLPNDGLHLEHMMSVVHAIGLECEVAQLADYETVQEEGDEEEDSIPLESYVSAYLRAGIPLILSFDFNKPSPDPSKAELHAVAIVGYGTRPGPASEDFAGFKSKSTLISELYVHDDRLGPYAAMRLIPGENRVLTSWKDDKEAWPFQVIVPIHQQIRIPYTLVLNAVEQFDSLLNFGIEDGDLPGVTERPEWDIYLLDIARVRREIRADQSISGAERKRLLTMSLPHFIWRARGYVQGISEVDLVIDATDLRQGAVLIASACHTPAFYKAIAQAASKIPPLRPESSVQYTSPLSEHAARLFGAIIQHFSGLAAKSETAE